MLAAVTCRLRSRLSRWRGDGHLVRRARSLLCRIRYGTPGVHSTALIGARGDISSDIVMAEYAYVGPDCIIGPGVSIGAYSMFGPRVIVVGDDHVFDLAGTPITFAGRPRLRRTHVGKDVWVGCNSILMAGVSLGDGAIVAAGSIVTKNVEPFSIVAGVPARRIRWRFPDEASVRAHVSMLSEKPRSGRFCGEMHL